MKKVLLALFLMSGFASTGFSITDFSITDERGFTQSSLSFPNLELDIPTGSVQQYKINATDIIPDVSTVIFRNASVDNNILLRFNAGVTSKRQVIFKVSDDDKNYSSDYYALSSCEVDESTNNRPTRSFFIINSGYMKFLKFYLRDCKTGNIETTEKINLQTTLLAIRTQMSDNSVDPKGQNGSSKALPTVIIGKETTRYLSTRSATGKDEFLCGTTNNIQSLELFDRNGGNPIRKLNPTQVATDQKGTKINFTIENRPGINYRKMYLKLTCNNNNKEHLYYFDARPKEIRVSGIPKDGWLYAEQRYKSDDGTAYDDGFSNAIEQIGSLANCDNCKVVAKSLESKKMNAITLNPVDAEDNTIESYNSIAEIAITGKIYSDGSDQNPIKETSDSGDALIRPCVAGSKANCAIAIAEINGNTSSAIYTDIVNNQKVIAYNNVGPTVLYGVDAEWTKFSQSQATPLCDKLKSHHKEINGLVGCNIPFVNEGGGDKDGSNEINFYTFKPAVYKMLFESKNSPANDSYGTDKLTYIHTIKSEDYDATKNEIFEAADFNASILAIGASLESLKNNRTLSHYDNHLKVANELIFSGNPANPTITINGSKTNDIATDFSVTVNNDETDISGALMLTLEPNNPYNHKENYKANPTPTEITIDKNNITINSLKDKFYAGKNIKVNKLNLKREDLLARSYAHIGSSSLDINMSNPNNAELSKKIEREQAAFISSYKGDDLNFVDAAIIAPNLASSKDTTDGAVYLAGYCESTSLTACKEIKVFISSAIAGHINYYGFDFLAYGNNPESTTDSLFAYDGANFAQFKRGADFLSSFAANEVTITLKGDKDKAEKYCNIFRNCYELETDKFGTTFNSYKASITKWHGDGDEQGKTIVDNITTDGKNTRRKEQRLSF